AGEVHDRPHLFEGGAAAVGDVEGARLGHLPDLEVREVELDRARLRRHVEIEVMLARYERARALPLHAVRAGDRLFDVDLRIEQPPELELALRHALDRDRARANVALAARTTLLAGHRLFRRRQRQRAVDRQIDHRTIARALYLRVDRDHGNVTI